MAKEIYRRYRVRVRADGKADVILANPMRRKDSGAFVIKKFDPASTIDLPYEGIREEIAIQAAALLTGQPFPA